MAEAEEIPVDHPRHATALVGHEAVERRLAQAFASGRPGQAWLISGPRGVGKATLAYRLARHALATRPAANGPDLFGGGGGGEGPMNLHLDPDDPVFHRIAAASHADLRTIERRKDDKGRLRREIVIQDVRALGPFFALTPAEGGRRVAIIDAADEMNRNAANALLKLLEEPPENALLILIAHVPGWLPPTIRSRCRHIKLAPLPDTAVADILMEKRDGIERAAAETIAGLAEGSPGRAIALADQDGLGLWRDVVGLVGDLPRLDVVAVHAFADRLSRRGEEDSFRTAMDMLRTILTRDAVARVGGGGADAKPRLPLRLDRAVELWENIGRLVERAERVNLDRKQVVLHAFTALEGATRS